VSALEIGRVSLRAIERMNTICAWLALALLMAAVRLGDPRWLVAVAAPITPVLLNNRPQLAFFRKRRGVGFALATIPLDLLYYLVNGLAVGLGWLLRETVGEPHPDPVLEAFAEVGAKCWPPAPTKRPAASPAPPTLSA
jgi:hypothetical protein